MLVNKPSRSDEVLDRDQQLRVANEVRAHFESIVPKRPIKPNRSEPDPDAHASIANHHQAHSDPIPELNRLHHLKSSQSQTVLSSEGEVAVQQEFVETEYYRHMEIIDKQHHTTGTGFIKIGIEKGEKNEEERSSKKVGINGGYRIKSNPATNDWIPNSEGDDQDVYLSTKPSRSG